MEYTRKWIQEESLKKPGKTIEVWACSYEYARGSSKGTKYSHLKPVKGILKIKSYYEKIFYPYNKKGLPLESKCRWVKYEDHYFDNKEECVEFYTQRVQDRVTELEEQIKDLNLLIDDVKKLL